MGRLITILATVMLFMVSSAAMAAAPVRIGALFSVTGPASFLGEP